MLDRYLIRDFPELDPDSALAGARVRLWQALHRALYAGLAVFFGLSVMMSILVPQTSGDRAAPASARGLAAGAALAPAGRHSIGAE